MVGAVGGVIGVACIYPQTQHLAGASAAVAALIGAHIASVMINWGEDNHAIVKTLPWFGDKPIKIDQMVTNGYRDGWMDSFYISLQLFPFDKFCH